MTPPRTRTGRLVRNPDGVDLVLERSFRAPIEDVWQSLTDPDSTARWYGRWEGDAGPGKEIRVQMAFEQGAPWFPMQITVCEPPRRFGLHAKNEWGEWNLDLALRSADGVTTLTFTQQRIDPAGVGEVGPGWEYYLDNLVASRSGGPVPDFNDYYPAQTEYYLALERRIAPSQ
jgi:uncharacterized protein YndB with AHSA1/START domain